MPKQKFNPGDIVQLKAGGPKMVVEEYMDYNDAYRCSWFSGAKHNRQDFKEDALVQYEEE